MCGIAGAVRRISSSQGNGGRPHSERITRLVQTITEAESHRGPDGHGLWQSAQQEVVFGHRRLLLHREPFLFDFDKVVDEAVQRGVWMEINSSPERLDLNATHVRMAKARDVARGLLGASVAGVDGDARSEAWHTRARTWATHWREELMTPAPATLCAPVEVPVDDSVAGP